MIGSMLPERIRQIGAKTASFLFDLSRLFHPRWCESVNPQQMMSRPQRRVFKRIPV
jgi:hypothetical protein